jgi:hypothetical protein
MANLLLTSSCNRSRPSGFAGDETSGPTGGQLLSWENLIYIADFLRASGRRQVSLLGGEPTMHPECVDFILYLLERGFDVTVATDGLLSPSRLEKFRFYLAGAPIERLNFVCNLHDPVQPPPLPQATQRLHRFLALMGPWTQAGFNLNQVDFTLDFLFDAINRFGLKRQLRLSLAPPGPGSKAGFIQARDMRRVVERLSAYRPLFETHRVRPRLDCGVPFCQVSDAERAWLNCFRGHSPYGCGAAPHISPDMKVSHCLPLAHYQSKSLFEFDSLEQIDRHFARQRQAIKAEIAGIYAECEGCRCQEDFGCAAGGVCRIIGRFTIEAPIRLAGGEDAISTYRLPG